MSQSSASDPSNSTAENAATESPNGRLGEQQIDPTSCGYGYYVFSLDEGEQQIVADVIVTGNEKVPNGFKAGTEYWRIRNQGTQFQTMIQTLFITRHCMAPDGTPPFRPGRESFTFEEHARWRRLKGISSSLISSSLWGSYHNRNGHVVFGFYSKVTDPNGFLFGSIGWYLNVQGNVFAGEPETITQYKLTSKAPDYSYLSNLWTANNEISL